MLKDTYYVRFLIREMMRNPDHRLTRKLLAIIRVRPRVEVAPSLLTFIGSDLNLLPHQHAEILWTFRYLSKIPPEVVEHCKLVVVDTGVYYYVRSAAALLLCRTVVEKGFLDKCRAIFLTTEDTNVRIAIAILLMQSTGKHAAATLDMLMLHPNEKLRKVGKFLRAVRYDATEAMRRLKFLFGRDSDWILCDNMGVLFSMALSDQPEILRRLIAYTTDASSKSNRADLRTTLAQVTLRANTQLSNILRAAEVGRTSPSN